MKTKSIAYVLWFVGCVCLFYTSAGFLGCDSNPNGNEAEPVLHNEAEPVLHAVSGLPNGWTDDVIYANVLSSPVGMAAGNNGSMYVNDRCENRIMRLDSQGTLSLWTTTGTVGMDSIAFQPKANRLIGNSADAVYAITPSGATLLGTFSDQKPASAIIVDPRDDSILAVSWAGSETIRLYDKDLNFVKAVANVDDCLNMALDSNRNVLYYTESEKGTVTALDLTSGQSKIIRDSLGVFSPNDNLGVTLDDDGIVYYSASENGLFSYDPSQEKETFIMSMNTGAGVGSIYWWSAKKVVLQTAVLAGTLMLMDPTKTEPEFFEPNVNTPHIVGLANGQVILAQSGQLYRVANMQLVPLGPHLDNEGDLALDDQENLYMGNERSIFKIDTDSAAQAEWIVFPDGQWIDRLEWDAAHKEMVVVTQQGGDPTYVVVWRTRIEKGATPTKLIALQVMPGVMPSEHFDVTVDRTTGTIYVINKKDGVVSQLNEGQGKLETLFTKPLVTEEMSNLAGVNFFSPLNGFILTYLEERLFVPLDGSEISVFAEIICGMDAVPGYEDANGHFIGTHAGHVYRIRPCGPNDNCP